MNRSIELYSQLKLFTTQRCTSHFSRDSNLQYPVRVPLARVDWLYQCLLCLSCLVLRCRYCHRGVRWGVGLGPNGFGYFTRRWGLKLVIDLDITNIVRVLKNSLHSKRFRWGFVRFSLFAARILGWRFPVRSLNSEETHKTPQKHLAMQAMKNESGENPDPFFQLTYGPVFQEVYPIPRDPLQPKIGGVSLAPPY